MVESPQNGCPALRTATVGVGCVLRAPSNCLSIIIPLVYHKGGIDDNNAKFPIYLQFEPTGTALLNNVQKNGLLKSADENELFSRTHRGNKGVLDSWVFGPRHYKQPGPNNAILALSGKQ
jgi:hypothetical protein